MTVATDRSRRPPLNCPVCDQRLTLTRLTCPACDTELSGGFATCEFCVLTNEARYAFATVTSMSPNRGNDGINTITLQVTTWN